MQNDVYLAITWVEGWAIDDNEGVAFKIRSGGSLCGRKMLLVSSLLVDMIHDDNLHDVHKLFMWLIDTNFHCRVEIKEYLGFIL